MCEIRERHCENCGTTDPEEIASRTYSGCCNEPIVSNLECREDHR